MSNEPGQNTVTSWDEPPYELIKESFYKNYTFIRIIGVTPTHVIECYKYNKNYKLYAVKKLEGSKPRSRAEIELLYRASKYYKDRKEGGIIYILPFHEAYENYIDGKLTYFLVSEYMRGGTLENFVKERKIINMGIREGLAARTTFRLCKAIKHLHLLGICHRDIKPSNILLDFKNSYSSIKLSDFGHAKAFGGGLHTPCGTVRYMDPHLIKICISNIERSNFGQIEVPEWYLESYTPECDIWSLGCTIYFILAGYGPFERDDNNKSIENVHEVRDRVLTGTYKLDTPELAELSVEAKDLITKILKKEPSERLTIDEILAHPWMKIHIRDDFDKNKLEQIIFSPIYEEL